jgi:hypothetical protein
MYSREQLQGILLTVARPEVTIYRSDRSKSGYTIRIRIMFRASEDFLNALSRTFEQYQIDSIYRMSEGVNRDKPVLIVGKKASIKNLRGLIPDLPCSHSNWDKLDVALEHMEADLHLEEEGMLNLIEAIDNVDEGKK